jgi:hypothetical protein
MRRLNEYFHHRAEIFRHYSEEFASVCKKTNGRATLIACNVEQETIFVGFSGIRSVFRDRHAADGYRVARLPFVVGFYGSEVTPVPSRILIHLPRGVFAHPNSDGTLVCLGEGLPRALPADTLLLHVFRILSYAKYNIASAVDGAVVQYVLAQPPEMFPTDRSSLF